MNDWFRQQRHTRLSGLTDDFAQLPLHEENEKVVVAVQVETDQAL